MKNIKLPVFRLITALFLAVFVFALQSQQTYAQGVNDFVIESFDAKYELTNEDPQGMLTVVETINLDYSGQNRGILRAIPQTYLKEDLLFSIISVKRDGKTEPYITYSENDNTIVRIGDAAVYITGKHTYEITYQLANVIRFYDDHDELYWDVNGDQWLQTFNEVTAAVKYEPQQSNSPICYTGSFGATSQDCAIVEGPQIVNYKTTRLLNAGETLTIVQGFQKGYFTQPTWMERNWGLLVASPLFLFQLLLVTTAYRKWKKYGKDYPDRKAIAPYFERPKGLSVMQASYVLQNSLDPRQISASIIDLAIRGYIKIIETGEGKKAKHDLELIRVPDTYIHDDEKVLLSALFDSLEVGQAVSLESKKNKLYKTLQELSNNIDAKTLASGYYELSPKNAFKKLVPQIILAFVVMIVGFGFATFTNGVSVMTSIASVVLVIIFSTLMTRRSAKGNMLVEHMKGLKLYLSKAEKERIKMQDAVAAPLSANVGQPKRDRKFFEKLLPFAVAMGVEDSWSEAFADIYNQAPEWYQGSWSTFNTAVLVSSISNTASAVGTSFAAPSSSGSSGFSSGGGFSGGGGGGGGGGGW